MVSKKEEIQNKSESLKIMQIGFKQVMDKYKSELTGFNAYNSMSIKNIGRRALGFYFGEYISDFEFGRKYNRKYTVEQAQVWVSEPRRETRGFGLGKLVHGGFEGRNYCTIRYNYPDNGFMESGNATPTGFICYKKDILEALSHSFLYDLWLYHCKNKKYTKSMADFSKELYVRKENEKTPKGTIDLFDIVDDFFDHMHRKNGENDREGYFIDIVTEKQLKLKDVIICIYPK